MYEENVIHGKEGKKSMFFKFFFLLSPNPLEWVITQSFMFDVTFYNWTSIVLFKKRATLANGLQKKNPTPSEILNVISDGQNLLHIVEN